MTYKPIKNNSKLLYTQAKALFDKANALFKSGGIKSETKLLQTIFSSFQKYFEELGKPMLVPRYAIEGGPPWSKDYNDMMDEIKQDFEILYQEIDILGRSLYLDFNHNMVQYNMLQDKLRQVNDKLQDLTLYTNFTDDGNVVYYRDNFANRDHIDFDRISGLPAYIEHGSVTLQPQETVNVSQDARVTIVTGNKTYTNFIIGTESNGFPGNNAEITVTPGSTLMPNDYLYHFVGEKNNHGHYGVVLDGNPNTWFEYELVNLREHEKVRVAKNLGWEYRVHGNQTIVWARDPEDGILKLHLQIVLDQVQYINRININMYTPPNHGAQTARVKDILVSDGESGPESVIPPDHPDEEYSYVFSPRRAKVISVLFEQDKKYYTDIGHIYYELKQDQLHYNYVFDTDGATYEPERSTRVEGPIIGLQDLGIEVNVSDQTVDAYYPMQRPKESESGYSIEDRIKQLQYDLNDENIEMGIEKFEGWRYAIGIRDIEIFSFEYEAEGEIVTENYYFDRPLHKISLSVDEEIPEVFYRNDLKSQYEWIQYAISTDDGASWHPISPLEHPVLEGSPPSVYTIQQVETETQSAYAREGYIESTYPVYSVRLRARIRRPTNLQEDNVEEILHTTPVLRSYVLKGYLRSEEDTA